MKDTHIEAYIERMLVTKMKREIRFNRNDIFKTYKEFCKQYSLVRDEIESIIRYTHAYQYLDEEIDKNPISPNADFGIFRYKSWPNRDYYPVIFLIMDSEVDAEEKMRMVKLLESYVIRRAVCKKLSTSFYNKHAAQICKDSPANINYEYLCRHLLSTEKDTTVFPDNERVILECQTAPFYGSEFSRYIFGEIEKSLHDEQVERVIVEKGILTIDHILPQGWDKNAAWRKTIFGENHELTDETAILEVNEYLHRIGNLTMMSGKNNSVKSNNPWEFVRSLLKKSGMKLNNELAQENEWNVNKIRERGKKLAEIICTIWPYPEGNYKPIKRIRRASTYTLEDEEDFTGSKIISFNILKQGEKKAKSWVDYYIKTMTFLLNEDVGYLYKFQDIGIEIGKERRGRADYYREIISGIFLYIHNSAGQLLLNLKNAVQETDFELADFEFTIRNDIEE